MKTIFKAYKFRLYPNKTQKELIEKTFGCCRFVYNQLLALKKEKYENGSIKMSKFDCNNYCNQVMKKEYEWLNEVDSIALTNSIFNMDSKEKATLNLSLKKITTSLIKLSL